MNISDMYQMMLLSIAWLPATVYGQVTDFKYLLELEEPFIQQWVDTHNYYRRLVSDPEAANMRLMTWDKELAELAETAVRTCSFTHTPSAELKTSVFSTAGENLYTGGHFRFSQMMSIEGVTKLWYDEVQHYDYTTMACKPGEQCGHYTQVVWADSYKVGCAIANCRQIENGYTPYLISCNYGPAGNLYFYSTPISPYLSGPACSQCGEGNMCIDQLCNYTAKDISASTTTSVITSTAISTTTPTLSAASVTSTDTSSIISTRVAESTTSSATTKSILATTMEDASTSASTPTVTSAIFSTVPTRATLITASVAPVDISSTVSTKAAELAANWTIISNKSILATTTGDISASASTPAVTSAIFSTVPTRATLTTASVAPVDISSTISTTAAELAANWTIISTKSILATTTGDTSTSASTPALASRILSTTPTTTTLTTASVTPVDISSTISTRVAELVANWTIISNKSILATTTGDISASASTPAATSAIFSTTPTRATLTTASVAPVDISSTVSTRAANWTIISTKSILATTTVDTSTSASTPALASRILSTTPTTTTLTTASVTPVEISSTISTRAAELVANWTIISNKSILATTVGDISANASTPAVTSAIFSTTPTRATLTTASMAAVDVSSTMFTRAAGLVENSTIVSPKWILTSTSGGTSTGPTPALTLAGLSTVSPTAATFPTTSVAPANTLSIISTRTANSAIIPTNSTSTTTTSASTSARFSTVTTTTTTTATTEASSTSSSIIPTKAASSAKNLTIIPDETNLTTGLANVSKRIPTIFASIPNESVFTPTVVIFETILMNKTSATFSPISATLLNTTTTMTTISPANATATIAAATSAAVSRTNSILTAAAVTSGRFLPINATSVAVMSTLATFPPINTTKATVGTLASFPPTAAPSIATAVAPNTVSPIKPATGFSPANATSTSRVSILPVNTTNSAAAVTLDVFSSGNATLNGTAVTSAAVLPISINNSTAAVTLATLSSGATSTAAAAISVKVSSIPTSPTNVTSSRRTTFSAATPRPQVTLHTTIVQLEKSNSSSVGLAVTSSAISSANSRENATQVVFGSSSLNTATNSAKTTSREGTDNWNGTEALFPTVDAIVTTVDWTASPTEASVTPEAGESAITLFPTEPTPPSPPATSSVKAEVTTIALFSTDSSTLSVSRGVVNVVKQNSSLLTTTDGVTSTATDEGQSLATAEGAHESQSESSSTTINASQPLDENVGVTVVDETIPSTKTNTSERLTPVATLVANNSTSPWMKISLSTSTLSPSAITTNTRMNELSQTADNLSATEGRAQDLTTLSSANSTDLTNRMCIRGICTTSNDGMKNAFCFTHVFAIFSAYRINKFFF